MDVDLVLAPADCSEESERAVEYAVAVADRYEADIHLLYVVDEGIVSGIQRGELEAKAIVQEHHAFAAEVEEMVADAPGVGDVDYSTAAGFSPRRLAQTPGSVILDAAEQLGADFVVMPRETPSGDPEETLGKAALYVLEYASQPVLSV